MSRSKLSPQQIQQHTFDEQTCSNKVKIVGTELEINISADDGDSVLAIRPSLTISQKDVIMPCVGMQKACLYGANLTIQVSPVEDGDVWFSISANSLQVVDICAKRIKMTGSGSGHLVIHG